MFCTSLDFVCDYCKREFTRKYNLQNHIENCHMNDSCKCEVCEHVLGSPAGLVQHYARGHNNQNQPYPECDKCGKIFIRKHTMITHIFGVHMTAKSLEKQCPFCFKSFSSTHNVKRHVEQIHNARKSVVSCNECQRVFKNKVHLLSHIQTAHLEHKETSTTCSVCHKVYINKRNLRRHFDMHHGKKEVFKCEVCPKQYTSNHSLRRHCRSMHPTNNYLDFSCELCFQIFSNKDSLDKHLLSFHTNPFSSNESSNSADEYRCDLCDKLCSDKWSLKQHVKDHSVNSIYNYCDQKEFSEKIATNDEYSSEELQDDNFYYCEFCSSTFEAVYELAEHMKSQHGSEYCPSTCNVCFAKFFCKGSAFEHRKFCKPPIDAHACSLCNKLFTELCSLEFHTKVFHPQRQIADSNISSTNVDDGVSSEGGSYKCRLCDRAYYSDRSLKHHIKLKHTDDEAIDCQLCGKICSNKYYLASHIKMVHSDESSTCNFCEKPFKSRRNLRRHIEYTHMGMQRHKCVECEALFKEKRSLRKHVRTKHADVEAFPACHICQKRFESAKSCKIHMKLIHSFNINTYPCGLCSDSFSSEKELNEHVKIKHLAEDEIYKCEHCNLVVKGHENFESHLEEAHDTYINAMPDVKPKVLPRCIICIKDFSTRKSLKRHIKKFHVGFDAEELATYGARQHVNNIECETCLKHINDEYHFSQYQKLKTNREAVVFTCESCNSSFNILDYAIQRYKAASLENSRTHLVLSELCTTEMSDEEASFSGFAPLQEMMEPESTTADLMKFECNEDE